MFFTEFKITMEKSHFKNNKISSDLYNLRAEKCKGNLYILKRGK